MLYINPREVDYITEVVNYNYAEEERHYDEMHPDRRGKNGQPLERTHIFYYLYRLDRIASRMRNSNTYFFRHAAAIAKDKKK